MATEVDSPEHYQFGQLEAWDIIELAVADISDPVTAYHVASALKYLLRAARKGGDTDIAKASAHLKRETARHIKPASSTAICPHDIAEHFALNYGFVPGDVSALGRFLEDPKLLRKAAAYLENGGVSSKS